MKERRSAKSDGLGGKLSSVVGTPSPSTALALVLSLLAVGCDDEPAPPRGEAEATALQASQASAPRPPAEGPVVAEVNGRWIEGFTGSYSRGTLTVYTGEDPNIRFGERILFFGLPERPDGQRISYPPRKGAPGGRMAYEKEDPSVSTSMQWLNDSRYELKLGEEVDYKVPVTIMAAEATDPVVVKVHGTIVARTAGIEMRDGVIDRSFDHLDTIEWITREWIREHHVVKSMAEWPDTCFTEWADPAARPVAGCSYLFMGGQGEIEIAKLWLEKLDGSWQVVRALEPSQLLRAHPIKPPPDRPPAAFETIAALRFENEIYRPAGGFKRIREPFLFNCGGGQVGEQPGYCEVVFAGSKRDRDLASQDAPGCHFVTYLLEQDSKGSWQIAKTFTAAQRYNPSTQEVEPRTLPKGCAEAAATRAADRALPFRKKVGGGGRVTPPTTLQAP